MERGVQMRLWIATVPASALLVGIGTATMAKPHKSHVRQSAFMAYMCAKCGVGASHTSQCPICHGPEGRLAAYACLKCQVSSARSGPCPPCHEPMVAVASRYKLCPDCGFY